MAQKEKRKLTVLQNQESDEPVRPEWQWIGFGVLLSFGAWIPLAYVASRIALSRIASLARSEATPAHALPKSVSTTSALWMAIPHAFAFALASGAGAYVIVRFGPRTLLARAGALSGCATAVVAVLLASSRGVSPYLLTIVPIGALCGLFGGKIGMKKR